jgi:hypothetical protein
VVSWLNWCASRKHWPGPQLPGDAEQRKEHSGTTRALPRVRIERLLSRRDIPLREKTLWRILYETVGALGLTPEAPPPCGQDPQKPVQGGDRS